MKKMTRLLSMILALAMLFALVSCGSTTSSESAAETSTPAATSEEAAPAEEAAESAEEAAPAESTGAQYGGSVTLYYTSDIDANFDPTIGDNVGWDMWMETLFTYDLKNGGTLDTGYSYTDMTGLLAESYEIDEEAMTVTVTLRDNIYFQDKTTVGMDEYDIYGGRQFTASDVKWNYDRAIGIGDFADVGAHECTSTWDQDLSMISEVEALDDLTVVFHFNSMTEIDILTFMQTYLHMAGPEWDTLTDEQKGDWHYACGTGPYILTNFVGGESASFTKNVNYYGVDDREGYEGNQLPYIDEVNWVYISDTTNAVSQFSSGALDYIGGRSSVLNDSEIAQLDASGVAYVRNDINAGRYEQLAFKCNQAPFDNATVREAVQHAIDLDAIATDYYGYDELTFEGLGRQGEVYSVELTDDIMSQYTYDPELCKSMLAEAGYADGLEFTVVLSPDSNIELYTYINATYFAPVGITMNIETVSNFMESRTIGGDATDPRCTGVTGVCGNYAMVNLNGVQAYTIDGSFFCSIWNGDQVWADMITEATQCTDLASFYEQFKGLDEYFLNQHWFVYMSGANVVTEFLNARIAGIEDGTRFYDPTLMTLFCTHMYVTDAQ